MTWPEGVLGRALAAAYLVAFPMVYVGAVWTIIDQLTGRDDTTGPEWVVWLIGAITIVALSYGLRRRVPEKTNRFAKSMRNDQRAYYRLALGFELPTAWRAVTGRGAGAGNERAN